MVVWWLNRDCDNNTQKLSALHLYNITTAYENIIFTMKYVLCTVTSISVFLFHSCLYCQYFHDIAPQIEKIAPWGKQSERGLVTTLQDDCEFN